MFWCGQGTNALLQVRCAVPTGIDMLNFMRWYPRRPEIGLSGRAAGLVGCLPPFLAAPVLVIGRYRIGFDIAPMAQGCRLGVFIEYAWSKRHPWLGRLFSGAYARWCTRRMARDAKAAFT
jgi:hypothetical protein